MFWREPKEQWVRSGMPNKFPLWTSHLVLAAKGAALKRVLRLNRKEDHDGLMSTMALGMGGTAPLPPTYHLDLMMFKVLYSRK